MANFLYKILGMFSLTDDYDEDDEDFDEDDYDDDEDEDEAPRHKKAVKKERASAPAVESRTEKKSNVLPYNKKNSKSSGMSVCVIKPTSFEDGKEISDTLVSGRAVVLNLEDVDGELAQRIFDFSLGACYSMGGNLQKVSTYIFIVTPSSVDIAGDFQDIISSAQASSSMSSQNRYRF